MNDDELSTALKSAAVAHEPDSAAIRARFDAGTWAPRPAIRRTSTPRASRRPVFLVPAASLAAVVAAISLIAQAGAIRSLTGGGPSSTSARVGAATSANLTPTLARPAAGVTASGSAPAVIGSAASSARGSAPAAPGTPTTSTASGTTPPGMTTVSPSPAPSPPPNSRVASPSPAGPNAPASCGNGDWIPLSPLHVDNNLWGSAGATGAQCVSATAGPGTLISWSTWWNWSGSSGTTSFASVVLGWQWGWKLPSGTVGLPIPLSAHDSVPTSWTYRLSAGSAPTLDVSYDLWFHMIPNPGWQDTPAAEVRVVLQHPGVAPPGTYVGTVALAGASWAVYREQQTWTTLSLVRSSPTSSIYLDLRDVTDVLTQSFGLSGRLYLSSVEAGTDVSNGSGRLDTSSYSVQVVR